MAEVHPIGKTPSPEAPAEAKPAKRSRPNKPIPTERIKLERQFDLLRAFAGVFGASGRAVSNKEVADIVQMSETTTSLANSFFTETGLLSKAAGGWIPSEEVVAYHRTYEWDRDNAARELQSIFARSWFWEILQPKLSFRAMEETDAINALGATSAASTEYKPNLKLIIDFLAAVGLIERDGSMLKLVRQQPAGSPEKAAREEATPERVAKSTSTVTTAFAQHPGGAVQFHINIDVSMTEIAGWSPDRIAAFFSGMAKVLAAKSGLEKDVAG
jgi:hypothetical protein